MKTISLLIMMFVASAVAGQKIAGHVFVDANGNGKKDANEEGVKGVAVSDQINVVETDATGAYQITATGYGFIFISVPSGYKPANGFWQKISGDGVIDFALAKSSASTEFKFIHASDTHISEKSLDRMTKLRAIVDEVKPDFVLITGDLVRDALRASEKEA